MVESNNSLQQVDNYQSSLNIIDAPVQSETVKRMRARDSVKVTKDKNSKIAMQTKQESESTAAYERENSVNSQEDPQEEIFHSVAASSIETATYDKLIQENQPMSLMTEPSTQPSIVERKYTPGQPLVAAIKNSSLKASYKRIDRRGQEISSDNKKGKKKQYKLTFIDQVNKGDSLAEVYQVESYKKYNAEELPIGDTPCCIIL